jgi:hypothetical protein
VKHVMDGPGGGKLELVSDWQNLLIDHNSQRGHDV